MAGWAARAGGRLPARTTRHRARHPWLRAPPVEDDAPRDPPWGRRSERQRLLTAGRCPRLAAPGKGTRK
eukprot:1356291-Alexandrium_andersonii.AAC.1